MRARTLPLISRNGLATRWGISRQTVREHTLKPDFPAPVPVEGGREDIWITAECERWRDERLARYRQS